jgi:heme/copper-type cytochrome/quinol oxidase subunit 2
MAYGVLYVQEFICIWADGMEWRYITIMTFSLFFFLLVSYLFIFIFFNFVQETGEPRNNNGSVTVLVELSHTIITGLYFQY